MDKTKKIVPPPHVKNDEAFLLLLESGNEMEKVVDLYLSEMAVRAISLFSSRAGWKENKDGR